jgi:hypothetical protein
MQFLFINIITEKIMFFPINNDTTVLQLITVTLAHCNCKLISLHSFKKSLPSKMHRALLFAVVDRELPLFFLKELYDTPIQSKQNESSTCPLKTEGLVCVTVTYCIDHCYQNIIIIFGLRFDLIYNSNYYI